MKTSNVNSPCPHPLWKNSLTHLTIYKNPQQIIVWGYERGATDGAPCSFSVSLLFFYRDLIKANLPTITANHPPHRTSVPAHPHRPLNDRRHLALWTWREPIQDEMEAYFGKPTKALKCKPPAACLAVDVFVLVERAAVAFHRGTRQKRRAMCGLLIFKPPVCQVSAVGMRPCTHTYTHTTPFPQSLSLSVSLPHGLMPGERSYTSCGVVISLFMICLEIKLRMA